MTALLGGSKMNCLSLNRSGSNCIHRLAGLFVVSIVLVDPVVINCIDTHHILSFQARWWPIKRSSSRERPALLIPDPETKSCTEPAIKLAKKRSSVGFRVIWDLLQSFIIHQPVPWYQNAWAQFWIENDYHDSVQMLLSREIIYCFLCNLLCICSDRLPNIWCSRYD